ncbi:hypothetical protein AAC387_Pa07g3339 [Persea americana]
MMAGKMEVNTDGFLQQLNVRINESDSNGSSICSCSSSFVINHFCQILPMGVEDKTLELSSLHVHSWVLC